jgi:chitin deacetylase
MRLYHFLALIALLIGIAHCFFEVVSPAPTGTALDQPEASAWPAQPESAPQEQTEPESAIGESLAEVIGAQIENIQPRRDVTQNLDYKCGPKWGKCPMGTCCSGSGKSLARSTDSVLTRIGYQVTVALPNCTAAPLIA